MGKPSKSVDVIVAEKKSHRTKAELEFRREQEQGAMTGMKMRERAETKADPAAHREFRRVVQLMTKAGKNDALYESAINRYAALYSEQLSLMAAQRRLYESLDKLDERADEMDFAEYVTVIRDLHKSLLGYDSRIKANRDMQLKIEREHGMTVAAAQRVIVKQPPKEESTSDPMMALLKGGRASV